MIYDQTTMPSEEAFNWDPDTIVCKAIIREDWKNVPAHEKNGWLTELHSSLNSNTFVKKLLDFHCFMTVIIRDEQVAAKMIVLENFQRYIQGPILYGPHNWPDIQ